MPPPLKQFNLLYAQNIRNYMLDKQGSHSTRDSVYYPEQFDLAQHYKETDCDIRSDLEI